MEHLIITALSIFFFPVVALLFIVIALASLGKTLGIRQKYVELLLKVFEFGKEKIDTYHERRHQGDDNDNIKDLSANGNHVIEKGFVISATKGIKVPSLESIKKEFDLSDPMYFAKCGVEAIIEDDVTSRFSAEELPSWNLLSRTNIGYHYIRYTLESLRLTILWCLGFFLRYFVLLPFRVLLTIIGIGWLIVATAFIGYLPDGKFKKKMYFDMSLMSFRILGRACSLIITFHNKENVAKNGICVANHTSPIDVIVLSCDNCYAMVGQAHVGLLGLLQRAIGRATAHIWFERSEVKDRTAVARRLKEHVNDENKLPILVFPEGTCINNTSVMMFKKGSFEVGGTIYPVAIKYDPRFGDAFWNSSQQTMVHHLLDIMTSWALVCDVWYLPPQHRQEGEDAVDFADRVKSEIARQGGLVDLEWDGQLKRNKAKESWKDKPREQYSKVIKGD